MLWGGGRRVLISVLFVALLGVPIAAVGASGGLDEFFGGGSDDDSSAAGAESSDKADEDWVVGEELTELRSESSATFRGESPGVFRTELHSAARFFEDPVSGELVELDASLVSGDAGWAVSAVPSELQIPDAYGGEAHAVSLRVGDEKVVMGLRGAESADLQSSEPEGTDSEVSPGPAEVVAPIGDAAAGVLEAGVVRFEDVVAGVDVLLEPTRLGVKETLVLEDAAAPRVFEFWIETDLDPVVVRGGGVHLLDAGGVPQAVIPAPYLQDSSEDAAGTGFSYDASWEVLDTDESGRIRLRLTAADAWLDDAERVWPVLLDPTLEPFDAELDDTYTFYGSSSNLSSETVLKAGNATLLFRSFIHFDDFDLSGKFIWDATLHLYQSGGSSGGYPYCVEQVAAAIDVRKVTSSWTTIGAWGNQPSYSSGSYGSLSQECGATWVSASVTDLAAEWAAGTSNYGVALREPSGTGRRDFNSMNASMNNPYLEVYWSENTGLVELPEAALPGGGMSGAYEQCVDDELFDIPIDDGLSEYVEIPGYELAAAAERCVAMIYGSSEFRLLAEEEPENSSLTTEDFDCLEDKWAALSEEDLDDILAATIDPLRADSATEDRFEQLYTDCWLTTPSGP